MPRCLQGNVITPDKPLLCPKCCIGLCPLAPEKKANTSLPRSVYVTTALSERKLVTRLGTNCSSHSPLPWLTVSKVQPSLGRRGGLALISDTCCCCSNALHPTRPVPREPARADGTLHLLFSWWAAQVHYRNAERWNLLSFPVLFSLC